MINVRDLHKSFDRQAVLKGVNLDIPKGQSLVLIGASGSGKSVLLKCILGLEASDKGSIEVDGKPSSPPQFLDRFGMLFQGAALFDSLTVWENVAFRQLHDGIARDAARDHAISKLAHSELEFDDFERDNLILGLKDLVTNDSFRFVKKLR